MRLLEEKGEEIEAKRTPAKRAALEREEDDEEMDEDADEDDPDKTMVDDDDDISSRLPLTGSSHSPSPVHTRDPLSTPQTASVFHTLQMPLAQLEAYYDSRFTTIQQSTCKLVVKAWIKVIEPKKQVRFPYNKGEQGRPAWWPEGIRHREPDHLGKNGTSVGERIPLLTLIAERIALLTSIVRSPLITVSRLELSTAEAAAYISAPRLAVLREVYQVAREEERRRASGVVDTSDIIVQLPAVQTPATDSPIASKKRGRQELQALFSSAKENSSIPVMGSYAAHSQKRVKHAAADSPAMLAYAPSSGEHAYAAAPFTYAPQWREQTMVSVSPYDSPAEASTPQMAQELQIPSWPSRGPSISQRRQEHGLAVPQPLPLQRSHSSSYGQHLHAPRRDAPLTSPTESVSVHSPQPHYPSSAGYYHQQHPVYPHPHQAHAQIVMGFPQPGPGMNYGQPFVEDAYHAPRSYSVDVQQQQQDPNWVQTPTEAI